MTGRVNVAVLGPATLIGEAVLAQLAERDFPIGKLYLLSPSLAAGDEVQFKQKDIIVLDAANFDFTQVQLAIFAAGAEAAAHFAPIAIAAGCTVIDTSPQFRQNEDVPLVVAGVNSECIANCKAPSIIACGKCGNDASGIESEADYGCCGPDASECRHLSVGIRFGQSGGR
jgi:Aspartate-semialdehyde dehydrogenase